MSSRRAERLSSVLAMLSGEGSVEIAALSTALAVSPATVRRDLLALEQQGLLTRTHGGAVGHGVLYELPLRYRAGRQSTEKQRIGAAAAAMVNDNAVVGITGGTTTTEVARSLAGHVGITIVTNSLNIASELAVHPQMRIVVTGGTLRSASYELVGPSAEATIAGYNLDIAIVGVDGIAAGAGCTTHDDIEAHTNAALVKRAARVVVVADASKLGRVTFAQICPLSAVHTLITDSSAPEQSVKDLAALGIDVQLA